MKLKEQPMAGYIKLPPIVEEMADKLRQSTQSTSHIREDATGHLLCWGCGEFGQHGHGYKKEVSFLDAAVAQFCVENEHLVKHIGCGASHTAVVTNSDELYLWGNGNNGQLGSNDLVTRLEPQKVSVYSNQSSIPDIAGVSCGGRHTMLWLNNGHVFTFGNNFNAQLGYDFREKQMKENQTQPTLLRSLLQRPVAQVACGDKHSVFRFKDGRIACVGNNAHGQIGNGCREDALVPRGLDEELKHPIKTVAAGAQHTMAVTDAGTVYIWGYSKACGSKSEDVLEPRKMATHRQNIKTVAGGSSHSMALSANGSVYTWGCGADGQLGHGENVKFLSSPRRVKDRHVIAKCVQISCGETFSAAVTDKGLLYMWGKNSHTIIPDKPTTHKVFLPHGVNKNFRGGRVSRIVCGSWHAVAQIGRPDPIARCEEDGSGESNDELVQGDEEEESDDDVEINSDSGEGEEEEMTTSQPSNNTNNNNNKPEPLKLEREKTTVSLADFYAPTPDPNRSRRTPSPETFYPKMDDSDKDRLNSTRSAATLIVQLPLQPISTYADAACSPMTLTTISSNKTSSVTTMSRVPSPVAELPHHNIERLHRKLNRPDKKFREYDPHKFERDKGRSTKSPISEFVQVSKTSADAFTLPREPSVFSKKQMDFSEMEDIRLNGRKSPDKLSRLSRRHDSRESSPTKFRELSPTKWKEGYRDLARTSLSRHRYVDSSLSFKSDSALMESPLFRGGGGSRGGAMDSLSRKPWDTPVSQTEERQYKHHVPKHPIRRHNKNTQATDCQLGLQVTRTQTILTKAAPGDGQETSERLTQLRRYAAIHNPNAKPGKARPERLRPIKHRQVSIPAGHGETSGQDRDQLYIGTQIVDRKKGPLATVPSWQDRSMDLERMLPRKMAAAGIVKMYLGGSDIVGSVDSPLYTSLSDGRPGHSDCMLDQDSLIVQPLLKRKLKAESPLNLELPSIAINQTTTGVTGVLTSRSRSENRHIDSEEFDAVLGRNTPRGIGHQDHVVKSRCS